MADFKVVLEEQIWFQDFGIDLCGWQNDYDKMINIIEAAKAHKKLIVLPNGTGVIRVFDKEESTGA